MLLAQGWVNAIPALLGQFINGGNICSAMPHLYLETAETDKIPWNNNNTLKKGSNIQNQVDETYLGISCGRCSAPRHQQQGRDRAHQELT